MNLSLSTARLLVPVLFTLSEEVSRMASNTAAIEEKITRRVVAAGVRLRFDKVALRLLDGVKAGIAQNVPSDQSVAFTVTAPIKLPAKTCAALQEWLHRLPTQELSTTINGNEVRARVIDHTGRDMPRVIGFIHSVKSKGDVALDIAEMTLREQ